MAWFILLLIAIAIIAFIASLSKRNKVYEEVAKINTSIEKEGDKFTKLMTKIINDPSFEIIDQHEEFQIISFSHALFDFGDVDWKKLPKAKLKWLFKFFVFLVNENSQYPIILMKDKNIVIVESRGELNLLFLKKPELKKHLEGVKKKLETDSLFETWE